MVIETAGGKKDAEKQDLENIAALPGYAEVPLQPQPPAKECWQKTGVKCHRERNKGCCGCLTLLLILGLIGVSIYLGVMNYRYKTKLARKCSRWNKPEPWGMDDMDDEMDYMPIDPAEFDNMHGWERLAAIVANCTVDVNELDVQEDIIGDEEIEDINQLSVDAQCLRRYSRSIRKIVRRLFHDRIIYN